MLPIYTFLSRCTEIVLLRMLNRSAQKGSARSAASIGAAAAKNQTEPEKDTKTPPLIIGTAQPLEEVLGNKETSADERADPLLAVASDRTTTEVTLSADDTAAHTLILGATGCGKSTAKEQMLAYRFQHGLASIVLTQENSEFQRAVSLFARFNPVEAVRESGQLLVIDMTSEVTIPFNPLAGPNPETQGIRVLDKVEALVEGEPGPLVTRALRACIQAGAFAGLTMNELPRLFDVAALRTQVRPHLSEMTASFWDEYEMLSLAQQRTSAAPARHRLESLLAYSPIRRMFSVPDTMDWETLFETVPGMTVIINLGVEEYGSAGLLLGALLLESITAALMSSARDRADAPPVLVFMDEFQGLVGGNKASDSLVNRLENLLARSRKFKLATVLLTQSLDALPTRLQKIVLTNTRTKFFFQCGSDAKLASDEVRLEGQNPVREDLRHYISNQEVGQATITRRGKDTVFATLNAPLPTRGALDVGTVAQLINTSNRRYGMSREAATTIVAHRQRARDVPAKPPVDDADEEEWIVHRPDGSGQTTTEQTDSGANPEKGDVANDAAN